jgi:NodT family efflux transporter outer membrane factor (OMF) lipoprotein
VEIDSLAGSLSKEQKDQGKETMTTIWKNIATVKAAAYLVSACVLVGCGTPGGPPEPAAANALGGAKDSKWAKPQDGAFIVKKEWWTSMGDPVLDDLIKQATQANIDLALLVDRTRKAEIELKGAKADQWPKLSATAGYSAIYSESLNTDGYSIGAGLGWELDVWGRLSEKKEAQLLEYQATEADWRAGFLLVVGGVSRTYVFIRQLDEQQALHNQTLTIAKTMLELYKQQQTAGVATVDKVAKQRAEILRLDNQLKDISGRRKLLENELALLLGKEPGTVTIKLSPLQSTVKLIDLPKSIEANLLQRRPDLVAAELRVKSTYRMQESMRAARWPRVSIGVGAALTDPTSILASNWVGMIVPKITFPNLDPQTKIRLQLSEVQLETTQKQYKKSVLAAINEVAGAMVELGKHRGQLTNETKRLGEYELIRKTQKSRVEAGVATKVELLGADLDLLAVKQRQLDIYAQLVLDQINLHNALGGGW